MGGIIDTIAFEVTTNVATAVARCGIYKNTGGGVMYPSTLVVDSGEFDCGAAAGVKSTAGLSIAISPDIYWFVYKAGVATPNVRHLGVASHSHVMGFPSTMGANLNQRLLLNDPYAALQATFPAGGAFSTAAPAVLVAVHYSS
jgi:hypothetical protein